MPEPLYVPVLPMKPHAARTFAGLPLAERRYAAPLWTLPPHEQKPLQRLPESALSYVARSRRFTPGAWLDVPYLEDCTEAVTSRLHELWTVGSLTPVTAPGRPLRLHDLAVMSAASPCGGERLGIRVALPGRWDETRAREVGTLLAALARSTAAGALPVAVDLLLDLDTVLDDRLDAGKQALLALDALVPLAPWRHIAVLSGASPKQALRELPLDAYDYAPRHDWALWHEIRDAAREYGPRVRYGDYGALPAEDLRLVQKENDRNRGGPTWGAIRYTTETDFRFAKFRSCGEGRHDSIRAAARRLLAEADYRGRDDGWSDEWLTDCALGAGSVGVGNATSWNQVSNHQHFTHIIRALRR
ncbi:beta family protein [Streptomyces sp. AA1529]|uniref:beta family protein n=1 Tax=Streptomyces sp. AA1529 TaxID=1203257 RepID=UPI003D728E85